jgi:hypothetical protein
MNKDQKLLEEAYQSICESTREPEYFGPPERKQEFLDWLAELDHEVHEDIYVSVKGDVDLSHKSLERLPFNFRVVTEEFFCNNNKLTSLKGAPKKVIGRFHCANNNLTSLQGAPKEVKGSFHCSNNNLTSLQGAPEKVGENFYCSYNNKLTSLEGAPEAIRGEFKSDNFSDEDYRRFVKKREYVKGKLDKEFDVDLKDF